MRSHSPNDDSDAVELHDDLQIDLGDYHKAAPLSAEDVTAPALTLVSDMDLASVSAVEVMAEEWISTTILSMVSQPGALERRGTATLLFD
jgi:hypothetical protein